MYKNIIELLKGDLEDLKENLLNDEKMSINSLKLMKNIDDMENAIVNIEKYVKQCNNHYNK